MAGEPYKDIEWLRQHYVVQRRSLKDIQEILDKKYATKVTVQTLYNWCERFDLLKFRGKGRKLNKQPTKRMPKSPMQKEMERRRREQRKMHKISNDARKRRGR